MAFLISTKKKKSKPGTNTFLMDEKKRALRGWILYVCVCSRRLWWTPEPAACGKYQLIPLD